MFSTLFFVLVKGLLMGLAIAAPVGPIALLCIRRTLDQGRLIGFVSGLGAATADGLYGAVAAFGLTALSDRLIEYTLLLKIVGGLFLCYLGLKSIWSKRSFPHTLAARLPMHSFSLLPAYTSTLALTLTNPATILSFLAIFAGLGITQTARIASVTLVFGVFAGSILWWLVLVSGVAYLRNRLTAERLARFNQLSGKVFGVLILCFGIAALALPS